MGDLPPSQTRPERQGLFPSLKSTLSEYVALRTADGAAGLAWLRSLARARWYERLGLALLLLGVVATPFLTLLADDMAPVRVQATVGGWLTVARVGLWLALLLLALAWAFLLHGASAYSLGAYLLAVAYTLYFGLYPAMALSGQTWFALVPLWLALQGALLASPLRSPWRHVGLLGLALLAGFCSYPALGLTRLIPQAGLAGRLALGLLTFGLLEGLLVRGLRGWHPALVLAVTMALFALLYAGALVLTPAEDVLTLTYDALHTLLGLAGLYWLWMGLGLFTGAHDAMAWAVRASQRVLPRRLLGPSIALFWVARLLVDYFAAHVPPLWLVEGLQHVPGALALLTRFWQLPWSLRALTALHYDLSVTAAVVAIALARRAARRLTHARLVALFGYSLLALLALLSGTELFLAVAETEGETLIGLWPLLLFVVGTVWQVVKSGSVLAAGSHRRKALFLAFLLLVVSTVIIELGSDTPLFRMELTLNTLLGALYLGIPYLLYRYVYQHRAEPPLTGRDLLLLFGAGMASALPTLWFDAWYLAPLLWCLAILAIAWPRGRWTSPMDALLCALAPGLGCVIYLTQPIAIPLPAFFPQLSALVYAQSVFAEHVTYPWQTLWWLLLVVYSMASALLGLLSWRARQATGWRAWAWLALGCAVSMAVLIAANALAQA